MYICFTVLYRSILERKSRRSRTFVVLENIGTEELPGAEIQVQPPTYFYRQKTATQVQIRLWERYFQRNGNKYRNTLQEAEPA